MVDTHMKVTKERFEYILRIYQELHGKNNVVDIDYDNHTFTVKHQEVKNESNNKS